MCNSKLVLQVKVVVWKLKNRKKLGVGGEELSKLDILGYWKVNLQLASGLPVLGELGTTSSQ